MIIASLIQLWKDVTIPWISKVAIRGLFQFRNQLQSFTIRSHLINLYLCSAWTIVRVHFFEPNFAMRILYTALQLKIFEVFKLQWNLRGSFYGLASHLALTFRSLKNDSIYHKVLGVCACCKTILFNSKVETLCKFFRRQYIYRSVAEIGRVDVISAYLTFKTSCI